jgi:hypothetical protein
MSLGRSCSYVGTAAVSFVAGCMPPQGSDDRWAPSADWETPGYSWPPIAHEVSAESTSTHLGKGVVHPPPKSPAQRTQLPMGRQERVSQERASREYEGPPTARLKERAAPLQLPQNSDACLARLETSSLRFERQGPTRGVELPIVLQGSVGGVEYWASDRRPLLVDCRLALALEQIGPLLRKHGVTRARFSGAYVYRTTRSGRLSHHAHGLAIDLHEVILGDTSLNVKAHFTRGAGCEGELPTLNAIACQLEDTGLFRELLTPDDDSDHHDHFHLAVSKP